MQMKLEVVPLPVTDVDRAKAFYVDQVGFVADHDHRVSDEIRFVQLTPPGSISTIPSPITTEQAEPGGVSWTNRISSETRWSWSATKPTWST